MSPNVVGRLRRGRELVVEGTPRPGRVSAGDAPRPATRSDGSDHVTYEGKPHYLYSGEQYIFDQALGSDAAGGRSLSTRSLATESFWDRLT